MDINNYRIVADLSTVLNESPSIHQKIEQLLYILLFHVS